MRADPYRKSVKHYERWIDPLNRKLQRKGMRLAPAVKGARVLDVGFGTGAFLKQYQNGGSNVFGIDMSPAMFDRASHRLGEEAELHLGDASAMPFPDRTFDLVIQMLVLHEISPELRKKILSESKRVVKKEGQILVIDYNCGPAEGLKGRIQTLVIKVIEFAAGKEHFTNYRHFISHGGAPALAEEAGLTVIEQKIVGHGNFGLFLLRP